MWTKRIAIRGLLVATLGCGCDSGPKPGVDAAHEVGGKRGLLVQAHGTDENKPVAAQLLAALLQHKPLAKLRRRDIEAWAKASGHSIEHAQSDRDTGQYEVDVLTKDGWDFRVVLHDLANSGEVASSEHRLLWLDTGAGNERNKALFAEFAKAVGTTT